MVKADTTDLEDYLDQYIAEFETKATEAVRTFAMSTVKELVKITPYGDSIRFEDYYQNRKAPLPLEEGMTRANWKVAIKGTSMETDYVSGSRRGENSVYKTYAAMQSYKLGDRFSFYNNTDYLRAINSQQAPQGVITKIEQAMMQIYKNADLQQYMKG